MRSQPPRSIPTLSAGACAALLVAAAIAFGPPAGAAPAAPAPQLSADAQRVVDYLIDDWQRQFRSTSVPLAMDNLGIPANDTLRLEVIAHLRAHTELANNLQYWGPNNYVLSNPEKRIAKYLIHMHAREGRPATAREAAEALEIAEPALRERLAFMAAAGFLQQSPEPLGFALVPEYKPWAGPLQHNFHTVRIEGERPFDVW